MNDDIEHLQKVLAHARHRVGKIVIGQEAVVDKLLIVIFTGGHALLEGVPGVAKTLMLRTLAQLLGCDFGRIQFTPDTTPSDIIGQKVYDPTKNDFTLIRGPIFTSFLMGDEINRAPAGTQAALLEAMQERRVTIDRTTYPLDDNFSVFATQNPMGYEGTYRLPEPQLDRFLFKIAVGYPTLEEEIELGMKSLGKDAPERLVNEGAIEPLLTAKRLVALRNALERIEMSDALVRYAVQIVARTRAHSAIQMGAGPRATQALVRTSRVQAALDGRDHVEPRDVDAMAEACLEHRIILRPSFVEEGLTCHEAIQHILHSIDAPE